MKRRLASWLGGIASLCAGLYFIRAVASHWHSFTLGHAGPQLLVLMGGALLLYLATYLAATRAWQLGLRLMGETRGFANLGRILMLSQFAKYLPGNIGHHVGRVLLAQRAGLAADVVVASMLLDMLLMVLAGAACSLPAFALLVQAVQAHGAAPRMGSLALLAVAVVACMLLALPVVRRRIAPPLARLAAIRSVSGLWRMIQAWLCHCASFLLGASALYLLCHLHSQPSPLASPEWLDVVGIYAAAWLLGFLMPGAPAGLGVRELVLLLGLSPLLGEQAALTAAAALRLVTTLGDGVAFGAAACLRCFGESHGRPSASIGH